LLLVKVDCLVTQLHALTVAVVSWVRLPQPQKVVAVVVFLECFLMLEKLNR
jgi:hypothetical protein